MMERGIDPINATGAMQQVEVEKEAQSRYLAWIRLDFGAYSRTRKMTIFKVKIITQHQSLRLIICSLIVNKTPAISSVATTRGQVDNGIVSFTNVDVEHVEQDIALANSGRNKLAHITCQTSGKQGHFVDKCEEEHQKNQIVSTLLMTVIENGEFSHEEHCQFLQHTQGGGRIIEAR
jgi:hypothetical protein